MRVTSSQPLSHKTVSHVALNVELIMELRQVRKITVKWFTFSKVKTKPL